MNIPFVDLKPQYNDLKPQINKRIQDVLEHGKFILGPEVAECEEKLAKFVGVQHAITCSNGTTALSMALMALGIKAGDEVITTAFSFIATAEVIALAGATPVFVDIESDTYNIDPRKIEEAITAKTKAIIPVSLYGQTANMDEINLIAKKHGLKVIEDGAQSFGAEYKGKRSCNLSDIGTTSFFPAKPLGCYGDGGAVFTNDDELASLLKFSRHHGQTERYYHPIIGMNSRMNTLQCAILIPKIERYSKEIEMRQQVATNYTDSFKALENKGVKLPTIKDGHSSVWAQYTLQTNDRDQLKEYLTKAGIPTAIHYPKTMYDQPAYKDISICHDISVSRKAATSVLSIPFYADMDADVQRKVIDAVLSFYS